MSITPLTSNEIEKRANAELFKYYNQLGTGLPINVELYLEKEYGVGIIPLPIHTGLDCWLSRRGTDVVVSLSKYSNPSYTGRLRFSLGHEMGHLALHHNENINIDSLSGVEYNLLEKQADAFAAAFIMPAPAIFTHLAPMIFENLETIRDNNLELSLYAKYRSLELSRIFGVSQAAMEVRLNRLDYSSLLGSIYLTDMVIEELRSYASNSTQIPLSVKP